MFHYNKVTDMLIILTFIDGVATTKNFYKFSDSLYNKIRNFFANKEEIKNFKQPLTNKHKGATIYHIKKRKGEKIKNDKF